MLIGLAKKIIKAGKRKVLINHIEKGKIMNFNPAYIVFGS